MNSLLAINAALRVSNNPDFLLSGQAIAAVSYTFVRPGQCLLICPQHDTQKQEVTFDTWFKCQTCHALDNPDDIDDAVVLTALDKEDLRNLVLSRGHVFLIKLRGFWLSQSIHYSLSFNGQFAALPCPLHVDTSLPLLSDYTFQQKEKLQSPQYPELDQLYLEVTKLYRSHTCASGLIKEIQLFLGASLPQRVNSINADFDWIKTIVSLGERSKELDIGKSNYQAGTDFENITRQGLEFLGFIIHSQHHGGAGGLDLYCSHPYPLVGECKAGKKIPSDTTEQLIKLGGMHLETDQFLNAAKLIIGPGEPTSDLQKAAQKWKVSIMSPNALQRLVEIQAKYPNSIDLVELREYLKPGVTDQNIKEFIEQKVLSKLRLRSQLLGVVSRCLREKDAFDVEAQDIFNACHSLDVFQSLDDKEIHYLLIELSSPFSGYLGRTKTSDFYWNDRFYFLRDLVVDENL